MRGLSALLVTVGRKLPIVILAYIQTALPAALSLEYSVHSRFVQTSRCAFTVPYVAIEMPGKTVTIIMDH